MIIVLLDLFYRLNLLIIVFLTTKLICVIICNCHFC